jgi:phosphatidate cytidylyltransferase
MKRVITAAVLIPLVLLLLLKGSFLLVVIATTLVAELATWEYISIADSHGSRLPRVLLLVTIVILFAATFRGPSLLLPAIGLCSLVLLIVCGFRSPLERVLPDTAFSVFGLLYCGLTMATVPMVWLQPDGPSLVVFLFCIVWTGDIAALYVGRNFGRTKLAPRISPNKSWQGTAASLIASLLIAAALVALAGKLPPGTPLRRSAGSLAGAGRGLERLRPGWRSGRVGDQARCRREGLRRHASRPRRNSRPHRCSPASRSRTVVRSMDSTVFRAG